MNTHLLLLAVGLPLLGSQSAAVANATVRPAGMSASANPNFAPHFRAFLSQLAHYKSPLFQWLKVMKPTLKSLGYTDAEWGRIKASLQQGKATSANATAFRARWASVHGEQLDPTVPCQFFTARPQKQQREVYTTRS